jgi:hypothetical protein
MILLLVASLKGTLPSSVEATAMGLFLIVGSIPRYLLRVSIRLMWSRMVHHTGLFILHIM